MNLIREILGWQGQLSIGCWHFKARSSLLVTAGGGEQRTNWKTTCLLLFLSASFPAFVRFVINFLLGYLYQLVLLFPLNRYITISAKFSSGPNNINQFLVENIMFVKTYIKEICQF